MSTNDEHDVPPHLNTPAPETQQAPPALDRIISGHAWRLTCVLHQSSGGGAYDASGVGVLMCGGTSWSLLDTGGRAGIGVGELKRFSTSSEEEFQA